MRIATLTAHHEEVPWDDYEAQEKAPYGFAVVMFGDTEIVRLPIGYYFENRDVSVEEAVATWLRDSLGTP